MASALVDLACIPEPFDGERLQEVARAFEEKPGLWAKVDTSGGTLGAAELVHGHTLCRVYADGEPVLLYVLQFYQVENRTEAFITAAFGHAAFDLCRAVLPLIERQCAGCAGLGIRTKRRGLMRKLGAAGYAVVNEADGVAEMRKAL
ncbi:hypothetical protein [Paraburkholderia dipogonis]|uniref:hypothetical protein n=1 Tax=Paraburkholderia dipogonis TaxID=1211383 RepID=UPI001FCC6133|nr:hypothetical protein [Paraburkholderia dipogonis]